MNKILYKLLCGLLCAVLLAAIVTVITAAIQIVSLLHYELALVWAISAVVSLPVVMLIGMGVWLVIVIVKSLING